MYSLHLQCAPEAVDLISAELWERGTAGIRELDYGGETVELIAGFETNASREELIGQFAQYSPEWEQEDATDWVQFTHDAWPPRCIGEKIFLAPTWCEDATPTGRVRVAHNPGLACGTGEHPCTRLALEAIEAVVRAGDKVIDIGTGSGILAIAAKQLGAASAVGIDTDAATLEAARENFELNRLVPSVAAGTADCIRCGSSDLLVANISGTVLLSIFDDLLRIVRPGGNMILTGFTASEVKTFEQLLPAASVTELNEWRCVCARVA